MCTCRIDRLLDKAESQRLYLRKWGKATLAAMLNSIIGHDKVLSGTYVKNTHRLRLFAIVQIEKEK